MICTSCGGGLTQAQRFCAICGAEVLDDTAATASASLDQPPKRLSVGERRLFRVGIFITFALFVALAAGYWWLKGSGAPLLQPVVADKTGTFAIAPQFSDASPFSEGLAFVVDVATRKIGYIDKSGAIAIAPRFDSGQVPENYRPDSTYLFRADRFSEGLAVVLIGDEATGRYGYVDKTGKLVIEPRFNYASDFSEGLAFVRDEDTRSYGYIDKAGKMVISQIGFGYDFSEGLAEVAVGNKHGYIDRTGTMVVPPLSQVGGPKFSEGLVVMSIGGRRGYFDRAGKIAINPQFEWASEFSDGLAAVRIGEANTAKWGYIDKTGQTIISPQFDGADRFSEGLAAVGSGGRVGFIDKAGKVVIAFQFDAASAFSEGLAAIRIGDRNTGKHGYIDKTGRMIINPAFDYADPFSDGRARVRVGDPATGKWGYIYR